MVGKESPVLFCQQALALHKMLQLLKLRASQGRIQVGQPVIIADLVVPVFPTMGDLGRGAQMLRVLCQRLVSGHQGSPSSAGDDFIAVEAEDTEPAESAGMPGSQQTA